MRVSVYKNLHNNLFSVKTKNVIGHTDYLILTNCEFRVQEKGRQRVIKEQRKNVHAYIKGDVISGNIGWDGNYDEISYNPYKTASFMVRGEPIYTAKVVLFKNQKVYLVL